jgi:high-affinity iron transporter
VLANFLIGLREGLEASLIVGILIAFAVKADRRDLIGRIWTGVGAAIAVSLGTGAAIFFVLSESGDAIQPIIVGSMSILAAVLLTWMIFWMAKTARNLKGSLEGSMQEGLSKGGLAIAVIAFSAVVREGVETALFIWASMNSTGDGLPALGTAFVGIAVAVILGWVIYRGLLRINLGIFFQWTSVILIIVAAGILAYGVHEFQEVGFLPAGAPVYDATAWLGKETIIGSLLYGLFSYRANPSLLELITWALYLVPTLTIFVTSTRRANNRRTVAAHQTKG